MACICFDEYLYLPIPYKEFVSHIPPLTEICAFFSLSHQFFPENNKNKKMNYDKKGKHATPTTSTTKCDCIMSFK